MIDWAVSRLFGVTRRTLGAARPAVRLQLADDRRERLARACMDRATSSRTVKLRRIVARCQTQSMDSRHIAWRLCTLLLVLGFAPGASAQTQPRHVLLLYSYEREFTHTAFAGMFRPELTRPQPSPLTTSRSHFRRPARAFARRMTRSSLAWAPRSQVPGSISSWRSAVRRQRSPKRIADSFFPRRRCCSLPWIVASSRRGRWPTTTLPWRLRMIHRR